MAKKWVIDDGPARKVRVVGMTESDPNEGRTTGRTPRVRAIGRRIVKMLVAIATLSVGTWLQAYHHEGKATDADEPHDAIGDGTINLI